MKNYLFLIVASVFLSACANQPTFVLNDPVTDKPMADTPYHIIFTERKIVRAGPGVTRISDRIAEGTTDHAGRTGEIEIDAPDNGDHAIVAKIGNGKYGRVFSLRWPFSDEPIRTWYEIRGCTASETYR